MVNFVYLIGDRRPARRSSSTPPTASTSCSGSSGPTACACVGALATHFHPDHVGGDMMGWGIEGITRLLEVAPVPIHVQADEAPWVARSTGVGDGRAGHPPQRRRRPRSGAVPITLVHTPGPHAGQPVLPGRRPPGRRRHPVPRRLRPDRPARRRPRGAVRVADHPAGPGARRHRALPRPPLLARAVGHHGRHPRAQLRVPAPHARAVDDHVRAS